MTDMVDTFTLKFKWQADGVWVVTSDNIKGVVFIEHSFQEMLDTIGNLVPELMEANGQTFPCDNHGDADLPTIDEVRGILKYNETATCECGETTIEDCAIRPARHCGLWQR